MYSLYLPAYIYYIELTAKPDFIAPYCFHNLLHASNRNEIALIVLLPEASLLISPTRAQSPGSSLIPLNVLVCCSEIVSL